MTPPSEDTTLVGEGWRKGDKTSQGLDAYELLARAHKAAQAEIESLTAQLIHRTQQRDNQIATIRELTAVNAGWKVRNEDADRLIEAQNITVKNQTAALARQEEVLRQFRQERGDTALADQRNLTSVHDLEDELQGLKVEREKLLQIYRELRRDKDTLETLLGTEKVAVSELRAQVEMATADRKSAVARADELFDEAVRLKNLRIDEAAARKELAERLQRLEQLRTEDQAAIKRQAETIKAIRSERGRAPSLLSALDQIQDAVLGTLEVTSNAGSGVRQVAEARRRQRLKYSVEHDYHDSHGTSDLINAAVALLTLDPSYWPREFDRDTYAELASEDTDEESRVGES
jgi:chromosome segregation ATPase